MSIEKVREKTVEGIFPFYLRASYVDCRVSDPTPADEQKNEDGSHVHPECEIYINLSGDVSFMVEHRIYPILPGDVVITRPYEYHHCIYHSDERHRHFWILFSSRGNEGLLGRFFDRNKGEGNLLTLSTSDREELLELCHREIRGEASESSQYRFLRMIHLLNRATVVSQRDHSASSVTVKALQYIDENFTLPITVSEIAAEAHVSVNTLERHFKRWVGASPHSYLKKKRLANAAALLYGGATVTEACQKSGFPDYAGFIALFKKSYGVTPLHYRRGQERSMTAES